MSVGDVSGIACDALKMAVEYVLGKIGEGKKLSAEDVLVLYLGTIADKLEGDVCRNRQTWLQVWRNK